MEHKQRRAADGSFLCIGDSGEEVDSDEELRRSLAAGEMCDFGLDDDVSNLMLDAGAAGEQAVDRVRCPTAVEVAEAVLYLCTTPLMQDASSYVHVRAVRSIQA